MLYWRISNVFLLLLLFVGACSFAIFSYYWLRFTDEAAQRGNWELAEELLPKFEQHVNAEPRYDRLLDAIYELESLRPDIDVFILSNSGEVLYAFADRAREEKSGRNLEAKRIDTEPLELFLDPAANPTLPLYGENPLRAGQRLPFSAARIGLGDVSGYLYILLPGNSSGQLKSVLRESYVIQGLLTALVVMLAATAAAGLLAFRHLTRPLRETTAAVSAFSGGRFEARADENYPDEIGALAGEFNRMADTITLQVRQLQEADELRRNLVANVSHDLRRPLTSMLGYLELLGESPARDEGKRAEYLEAVERNSRMLQRLAEDLFELSRLEAKEREPNFEAFSISDLVNDVLMRFRPAAEQAGVTLRQVEPQPVPYTAADPKMIELVLGNLLENALRYTSEGGAVEVSLAAAEGTVAVSVSDTGAGIPGNELEHIFERFFQADQGPGRSTGGTGLGLAIVKRIIDLHSTEIAVRSREGEGTVFTFRLRAAVTGASYADDSV